MHYTQRPYQSETDLPAVLALKLLCTTPEILYDRPTTGEMRRLLAPLTEPTTPTHEKQSGLRPSGACPKNSGTER